MGNRILDIGGFGNSLEILDKNFVKNNDITILNLDNVEIKNNEVKFVKGDATKSMLFSENNFDVVHCNSVIEHINTNKLRKALSENIQSWGKYFLVQTPNYYFPMEPHFLFPFFQFLPLNVRAFILTKISLGTFPKESNYKNAKKIVSSVRLLKKSELQALFPGVKIVKEKIAFFTKSFIAHNFE